ncbi:MAG: dethiobiotin synthase [Actinomycetota bacterium]
MPASLVVVSGTGTGVGKTWVAAQLVRALKEKGLAVAVRKPVQSFDPDEGSTDADVLAAAGGEESRTVCPAHRSYPIPMAPPIAAQVLGMAPFTIAELVGELQLPDTGLALIEGVGGPRSPLASDGDNVSLADALDPDLVLLVADPALGAINATLLAAAAFGSQPVVVFLNRFNARQLIHRTNLEWLTHKARLRVITDLQRLAQVVAGLERTTIRAANSS